MNKITPMSWQTFKTKLAQYPLLTLQFQYGESKWVDSSYHITEIKQTPIVSVDCGGKMNSWTEVIVQLWEPETKDSERAMQVKKAFSIIELVEKILPLNPLANVKIEFGNSSFDTRQMYPTNLIIQGDDLIVHLSPDFTQCKAIGRGESCRTTDNGEACCTDNTIKVPLTGRENELKSCTPGSGCC